jgi:hypothetical protein
MNMLRPPVPRPPPEQRARVLRELRRRDEAAAANAKLYAHIPRGPTTLALTEASEGAADDTHQRLSPVEASDDFTRDARDALAALEAHASSSAKDHVALMLRLGETLARARKRVGHGEFTRWCEDNLQRKPSWCAAHRRLFEASKDLEPAREWAAQTGHPWAKCRSVERLLRVVNDFRRGNGGAIAAAPRRRRKASEIIAELRQRLEEAEADFAALRDPLLPEEKARAAELAAAMEGDDFAAREELATLARKRHWRLRDLVAQSCGAPQVSGHRRHGLGQIDR